MVTGLTNGAEYLFRVAAQNQAGVGDFSAESPVLPLLTTPDAPTSITGTAQNRAVSLTWLSPPENGGAYISDYIIQHSADNGTNWETFQDGSSFFTTATVTGLTNGTLS